VLFYRVDGVYSRVDEDETVFGGDRSPGWYVFIGRAATVTPSRHAHRGVAARRR
jgi:hypothetical protein